MDTRLVRMVMRVLPAPRCAELMPIWTQLKIMPPMIILKYSTALSWVSSSEPQRRMIGSASATIRTLTAMAITTMNTRKVEKIWFASSRLPWPFRLATRADMDTLAAMNRDSPTNLGWVVSPTAATA